MSDLNASLPWLDALKWDKDGMIPAIAQDAETGRVASVDTSRRDVRDRFAAMARERFTDRVAALRTARVDVVDLRTDTDWVPVLAGFLRTRKRRLAAGGRR